MKKKISAKILVLAGILFAAGIASVLLGFLFIHSMNKKSQKISNECMGSRYFNGGHFDLY